MGSRSRTAKRPGRKPATRAGQALLQASEARRRKIREDFAARHPERAAEERALRKRNLAAIRDWSHKANGTPETHAKAAETRQGALARLYQSGSIDAEQLASAAAIALVAQRIGAEVGIRTVSLETRVDGSVRHDGTFFERLGAVRAEVAYTAWRQALPAAAPVLAMIVEDCGLTAAARRYGMGKARARALLIDALDLWAEEFERACGEISAAELAAWHAGLV